MRFLVDAQLPPGLAQFLREQGEEAQAVRDLRLRDADDSSIWAFAQSNGWVLVTKDEDFAERIFQTETGPQVVWLRIGNCTNPVLFTWLGPRWPAVLRELQAGQRLVEVKR